MNTNIYDVESKENLFFSNLLKEEILHYKLNLFGDKHKIDINQQVDGAIKDSNNNLSLYHKSNFEVNFLNRII